MNSVRTKKSSFSKTLLSGAIASALCTGMIAPSASWADIYEFEFSNTGFPTTAQYNAGTLLDCILIDDNSTPGIYSDDVVDCPNGVGLFSMLTATGTAVSNTSSPFYNDNSWNYGKRSQLGGFVSVDTANSVASMVINPFDFFNGGNATASDVLLKSSGTGNLWLSNMIFSWGTEVIATQVVFDMSGVLTAIPALEPNGTADLPGATINCGDVGVTCATPASGGIVKAGLVGPSPIATTTYNVSGALGDNTTVLANLSLGTDDSIGGSPMDNSSFDGFNANFDLLTLAIVGYNDTTAPTVSLSASSINIVQGDAFNENTQTDVTVSCVDAKDGSEDLVGGVANANISFNAVSTVNTSVAGAYKVTYTCLDNADRWAAVVDPTNPSVSTTPIDNVSTPKELTVTVVALGQPVITLNGSASINHEACTLYNDLGATAVDSGGAPLAPVIVTDNDGIDATSPNEMLADATIDYDISDGPTAATTQTRSITIRDTVKPTIAAQAPILIETTDDPYTLPPVAVADSDDCTPPIPATATTTDTINYAVLPGNDSVLSNIRYNASDTSINANVADEVTVAVTVERSEPVITLLNKDGIEVPVGDLTLATGDTYTEFGMNIHDVQGGDVAAVTVSGNQSGVGARSGQGVITYTVSGTVDTNTPNDYFVTYTATDSDTNVATVVQRKVTVANASDTGIGNFTMLDPSGIGIGGTNDVTYVWDGSLSNPAGTQPDGDGYTVPSDVSSVMTIASPEPFSGFNWSAKAIRVYRGPAKLKFDVTCQDVDSKANPPRTVCNKPLVDQKADQQYIKLDLAVGEIGAHMTFDWGSKPAATACGQANCDIDVILRWNENGVWDTNGGKLLLDSPYLLKDDQGNLAPPSVDTSWLLVSTDVPENGVPLADGGVGDGFNGRPMIDGPFNSFHANFNLGPGAAGVIAEKELSTISDVSVDKIAFSMGFWSLLAGLFSVFGLRRINNKK